MKNKILCFINLSHDLIRFSNTNKELIFSLSKKFKKIYIINLNNLRLFTKKKKFNKKKNRELLPKNFVLININSTSEFLNFSKNKKLIVIINSLSKSIYDFKIFYLLKKVEAKLIMISNLSMIGSKIFLEMNPKNVFKGYQHIIYKGFYYVWRILTIINIFPKIDLLLESNSEFITAFNTGLSRKFENIFPFFKISLYRKIIRVNSISYDLLFRLKNKTPKSRKKYILYIDSPLDSFDRVSREGFVDKSEIDLFYKKLFVFLERLSKIFDKRIIISLHPDKLKYFKKEHNKIKNLKKISISKKRTINLINESEFVVFAYSSAVLNAVILKKRVLGISSNHFGEYFLNQHKKYVKEFNFPSLSLDGEISNILKSDILYKFDKSLKTYNNYIKKKLINDRSLPSSIEIEKIIKRIYFN